MSSSLLPLVDEKNPLYCPAISAVAYLRSIRHRISSDAPRNFVSQYQDLSQIFALVLGRSGSEDESVSGCDMQNTFGTSGSSFAPGATGSGQDVTLGQSPVSEDLPPYSPLDLALRRTTGRHSPRPVTRFRQTSGIKRKSSFSDLAAPPKYARSVNSVHDSSFEIEGRHEKLQYVCESSSPRESKGQDLRDTGLPQDDIGTLIDKLDRVYPGIRLKERLEHLNATSAQSIVDFLGQNAYINERVLDIFCFTDITRIVLAPSMFAENGLNLVGDGMFSIFGTANGFRHLTELSFAGIRVQDAHIAHMHHLPNLSMLCLSETGIGDEGVFLLLSLKHTLTKLFLTANPDIGNDSVPVILFLNKLSFLSILDTGIDMIGLRRLAQHMHEHDHIMDIEIPYSCEVYVDGITTQYALNPLPPLITNPQMCSHLSSAALKRNLEAHACYNPSIVACGTRQEMVCRLSELLEVRKLDILVMGMLDGSDNTARNGQSFSTLE